MLDKNEINTLRENIEWAKLDIDKGSVYHIKWALKYVEDVEKLLDMVDPNNNQEPEARADEILGA